MAQQLKVIIILIFLIAIVISTIIVLSTHLTPSILWSLHQKQPGSRARSLHFPLVFLPEKRTEKAPPLPRSSAIAGALCGRDRKECRKGPRQIRTPSNVCLRVLCASIKTWNRNVYGIPTALLKKSVSTPRFAEARSQH